MHPETRELILEKAAEELVRSSGRRLTVRHLAAAAGTSTQAIYTLFGGKEGIVLQLYEEGWRRLILYLDALDPPPHPLKRLCMIGLCYLRFARANEHFYALMIGRAIGNVSVPEREIRHAEPWERVTRLAIEAAIDGGYLVGPPEPIGRMLWATAHGYIDLSVNHFLRAAADDDTAFIEQVAAGVFAAFAGPNYDRNDLADGRWQA